MNASPGESPAIRPLLVVALLLFSALVVYELRTSFTLVADTQLRRLNGTSPDGAHEDLGVFYAAGKMVLRGQGAEIYDRDRIGAVEQESWGPDHKAERLAFFNPPFVALAFAPLALLPFTTFSLVWMIVVAGMLLLGLICVDRLLGLRVLWQRILLYATVLASPAASWLVAQEQLTMFVFFGWLGFYWFVRRGEEESAGAMLVLALVKPQLVLPLLVALVWQRRWRALRGFALPAALLAALSLPLSGPGVFIEYPQLLLRDATEAGNAYRIMFSWVGFTARLVAEPPPGMVVLSLNALTVTAMALACAPKWQTDNARLPASLAALLAGALLLSPHLYRPELVLLVLVVMFGALANRERHGSLGAWTGIGLWLWLAFIVDIETGLFMTNTLILSMAGVLGYLAWQSRSEKTSRALPAAEACPVAAVEQAA